MENCPYMCPTKEAVFFSLHKRKKTSVKHWTSTLFKSTDPDRIPVVSVAHSVIVLERPIFKSVHGLLKLLIG